jgi:signal transduction histidine kinase
MGLPIKAVLPSAPVTLNQQQVEELYRLLAEMRHDINNDLSKIVGTAELIKLELGKVNADPAKPLRALDRMPMLLDQPRKISSMLETFSREFEKTLGITRP